MTVTTKGRRGLLLSGSGASVRHWSDREALGEIPASSLFWGLPLLLDLLQADFVSAPSSAAPTLRTSAAVASNDTMSAIIGATWLS
jgi:hypothetical protein